MGVAPLPPRAGCPTYSATTMPKKFQPTIPEGCAACQTCGAGVVETEVAGVVGTEDCGVKMGCTDYESLGSDWLWRKDGVRVHYQCGCWTEVLGPVVVNPAHPTTLLIGTDAVRWRIGSTI